MKKVLLLLSALIILGCKQEPLQTVSEQTFHDCNEMFVH